MIKDIYTVTGWYEDGTVVLLRNDKNKIPVNLDKLIKNFTWYYGNSYYPGSQEDPVNQGDNEEPIPVDNEEPGRYTIASDDTQHIEITPQIVNQGEDCTIIVHPDDGYQVDILYINNVPVPINNNVYVIQNIQDNVEVRATFKEIPHDTPEQQEPETPETYTVRLSNINLQHGRVNITPSTVESGGSCWVLLTPDDGYEVDVFEVDNVKQTPTNDMYEITNITRNIDIFVTFKQSPQTGGDEPQGRFPIAEAVDLDLPSGNKWASWNLGATSYDDPGQTDLYNLFQFGDPTGEVTTNQLAVNPYFSAHQGSNWVVDDIIAGTSYDIATTKWGRGWKLPTRADFDELIENCDIYSDPITDKNGNTRGCYLIVNKAHTKSIRIAATGIYVASSDRLKNTELAWYWTSETSGPGSAYCTYINGTPNCHQISSMTNRCAIRPIYNAGSSQQHTPQSQQTNELTSEGRQATYVDLGLTSGTKWATYNIGSTSQYNVGDYLPWAYDNVPSTYIKSDNKYYDENTQMLVGATALHLNGLTLPEELDSAHNRWGGNWRMPTPSQWRELYDECNWTYNAQYNGFWVTSKVNSTKRIFIPMSGYKSQSSSGAAVYTPENCRYWTCDLDGYYGNKEQAAKSIVIWMDGGQINYLQYAANREYGHPVRPVINE